MGFFYRMMGVVVAVGAFAIAVLIPSQSCFTTFIGGTRTTCGNTSLFTALGKHVGPSTYDNHWALRVGIALVGVVCFVWAMGAAYKADAAERRERQDLART